jgi:hypothetical protein
VTPALKKQIEKIKKDIGSIWIATCNLKLQQNFKMPQEVSSPGWMDE